MKLSIFSLLNYVLISNRHICEYSNRKEQLLSATRFQDLCIPGVPEFCNSSFSAPPPEHKSKVISPVVLSLLRRMKRKTQILTQQRQDILHLC